MSNLHKSIVLQFSIFTNTPYNIHTTEIHSTGVMVHTRVVARRTGDIKEESRTKQNDSRDAAYDQPHVLISNLGEDKTAGCGLPESHRIARRAPSYPMIGSNTNTKQTQIRMKIQIQIPSQSIAGTAHFRSRD